MKIDRFIGQWVLISSIKTNSEVEFIDGRPDPLGVTKWLNGRSDELIPEAKPTEGLTLNINPDGRFTEEKTGEPELCWYNYEGVQSNVEPFNGKLSSFKSQIYLIADNVPSWAILVNKNSQKKLRYNDGDTKIVDSLERQEDYLIRTVNVVTDDLYLDRIVLVYQQVI